jgi:hypothetical protein
MCSVGRRTKKLTVAFHFHLANQAAWKCDNCRRQGLEEKRRCAWLGGAKHHETPVWVRNGIGVSSCPKSIITGDSQAFLEEYQVRKVLVDMHSVCDLPARTVDAFCLLEQLIAKERSHEQ